MVYPLGHNFSSCLFLLDIFLPFWIIKVIFAFLEKNVICKDAEESLSLATLGSVAEGQPLAGCALVRPYLHSLFLLPGNSLLPPARFFFSFKEQGHPIVLSSSDALPLIS